MTRTLTPALLVLAALGCTHTPPLVTPDRFIELEEPAHSDYDYRATTADGVVLAVRELEVDAERGGDLQFWVDATLLQMRGRRGYALLEQKELTTAGGLKAAQLRFGRDEEGRTYRYWLTLALTDDTLYVIEAGGPEKAFDTYAEALTAAVASLKP